MTQPPAITVLMPVYNAEAYLAEALESVLRQSFTDFELLIVDDCSTDSSPDIIRSFDDPRIRYYRNSTNQGISPSLNRGLALARSGLIARMDADDICYPKRLEKQHAYMLQHPDCALLSCWVRVITEGGDFVRQDDFKSPYYYYNLTFECWMYHPTIMFRKEAVEQVGGYTVAYSEDFELFWHLSRRFKIHNLDEVLLDYRVSSQSLHQVQKKSEYHMAQHQQVLRNIRWYMGETYALSPNQVECLRHNMEPILQEPGLHSLLECLQKLREITTCILATTNPNRDVVAIQEAAFYKRRHLLFYAARNLSYQKAVLLLVKSGEWKLLTRLLQEKIKSILKTFLMI